jgi:para-nitrobenzyl esterase
VEDNWSLPFLLDQAISRGVWNRVPVLVGSNADEGTFFVRQLPESMTLDAYLSVLGPSGFGDPSGELSRAYPVTDPSEILTQLQRLVGDLHFGAPARAPARLVTRAGEKAYLYYFTRVADGRTASLMGATHGSEVTFAWGNAPTMPGTPYDAKLADAMSDYWTAFANSGNPNKFPGFHCEIGDAVW